ncbi:hypothetical protein ACFLXF_00465 [Chloroflexota bacterium]
MVQAITPREMLMLKDARIKPIMGAANSAILMRLFKNGKDGKTRSAWIVVRARKELWRCMAVYRNEESDRLFPVRAPELFEINSLKCQVSPGGATLINLCLKKT